MSSMNAGGRLDSFSPLSVGVSTRGSDVQIALQQLSNPHYLVSGMSGSGKSHLIRNIIARLNRRGLTSHIIELHPDMSHADFVSAGCGEHVSPDDFNYLNFDYVDGDASVNILQFNPNAESGGVYMAIQDVLDVARLFNPSLGSRQVTYLQKLLEYTYSRKGISHNDPATWVDNANPRNPTGHHPNLHDLLDSLVEVRRAVASGLGGDVFAEVEKLRRQVKKSKRTIDSGVLEEEDEATKTDDLMKRFEALKESVCATLHREIFGNSDSEPFYQGWKTDTLDSLADTIRSMVESSLFTRGVDDPQQVKGPRKGKINVYRLSNLSYVHQKTMIHILLTRIYNASMRMCKKLNPETPDTYLVLDEGRYAKEAARNPMSPLNVIMGGSRKFGLGAIIGVQGPEQISNDMAQNFATKFILACSEAGYADAKKYFNLPPARMKKITPKQDALVSINSDPFELVRLFPREYRSVT